MPDDIRDLLGRYASGSLNAAERRRLFEAALDDQEIFDQLAGEQGLKHLLDEPGARDRMIGALQPRRRRVSWVLVLAPVAMLGALILFVMRPLPKPEPLKVAEATAPPAASPLSPPPQPSESVSAPVKAPVKKVAPVAQPPKNSEVAVRQEDKVSRDQVTPEVSPATKTAEAKEKDLKKAAPSPPAGDRPVPATSSQTVEVQAAAPAAQAAPRARRPVSGLAAGRAGLFSSSGFHYSVETKGHLIVIPSADGFLSVKSSDGTVLLDRKPFAAGLVADVPLPDAASSITIGFSPAADDPLPTPSVRTTPEGTVRGTPAVAITVPLKAGQ